MKPRPLIPLLVLAFAAMAARHVPGQTAAPDLAEFEKRLGRINDTIKDVRAKLEAEGKKEAGVVSALERLGLSKRLIRNELGAQSLILQRTNAELAALRKETAALRLRLDRDRQSVEKTLVTLYKFGRLDLLQVVLKARNADAVLAESKRLSILARHQGESVAAYLRTLADLQAAEERLGAKQAETTGVIRDIAAKRNELDAEERRNRDLVREIQRNKESYGRAIAELGESARQLQLLMKRIESQEFVLPGPYVALADRKGRLAWPLDGKVITSFGRQKHPQFNTVTMNNGIEIAARKADKTVRAVHAGKVAYADFFEGYGNLIILDHGMAAYTLYGHCAEFAVAKGDVVRAGQAVATAGDTGSLKGECLYFEIRLKAKPLDPLQWLKRR